MPKLGRMLAVVAADADDLRGLDRRQQRCVRECNPIDAAAGQAFDVPVARRGRLEEGSGDGVGTGNGLDQPVVVRPVEGEAAVSHRRQKSETTRPQPLR